MFLPDNAAKKKREEKKLRENYARIEQLTLKFISPSVRQSDGLEISVQEVQCGDPSCSPIDVAINIIFSSGGGGMFGIPMEAKDVTEEDVEACIPPEWIIEAWFRGEYVAWPPEEDVDEEYVDEEYVNDERAPEFPPVRFQMGARVECRVGPDEWAWGTVVLVWYREPQWPENSWAPYKIQLDDGRCIFAPGDIDQVVRAPPEAKSGQIDME